MLIMMIRLDEAQKMLDPVLKRNRNDKAKKDQWVWYAKEKYNCPISTLRLCMQRSNFIESMEKDKFILYCFVDAISQTEPDVLVEDFFTKKEINDYSQIKYETKQVDISNFDAIRITENDFLVTMSARNLVELKNSDVIQYNPNTQRQLKHVTHGNVEYYAIDINKNTVAKIKDLLISGKYIADTITINMDETAEFSFSDNRLSIQKLDHFDIVDGMHRLSAMMELYREYPDWDYTFPVRITYFSESVAQNLIYQLSQQTKLKKIDLMSLDNNSYATNLIQKLDTDSRCDLKNYLNRNNNTINYSWAVQILNELYFKDKKKKYSNAELIELRNELIDSINYCMSFKYDMLEKIWSYEETAAMFMCFKERSVEHYNSFVEQINLTMTSTRRLLTYTKYLKIINDLS